VSGAGEVWRLFAIGRACKKVGQQTRGFSVNGAQM
jgi:hypothetical protein